MRREAPAPSIEATVQALARPIEAQQKLLEEQGRQIEQLRRRSPDARAWPERHRRPKTRPATGAPAAGGYRAPALDGSRSAGFRIPPDIVTAGEFPGAFGLPGSDAALKIGGLVRVNWVSTYDALARR